MVKKSNVIIFSGTMFSKGQFKEIQFGPIRLDKNSFMIMVPGFGYFCNLLYLYDAYETILCFMGHINFKL